MVFIAAGDRTVSIPGTELKLPLLHVIILRREVEKKKSLLIQEHQVKVEVIFKSNEDEDEEPLDVVQIISERC